MAAPVVDASTTVSNFTNSATLAVPSGTGGVLLILWSIGDDVAPTTTPSGMTEVAAKHDSSNVGLWIGARDADETEIDWTLGTAANEHCAAAALRISGDLTAADIVAGAFDVDAGDVNIVCPTATAPEDDTLAFVATTHRDDYIVTYPSGYTEEAYVDRAGGTLAAASDVVASGATGSLICTIPTADSNMGVQILVPPSAGGGSNPEITPQEIEVQPHLGAILVSQAQLVTPQGLQVAAELGAPTVTQVQTVPAQDLQAAPELEAPTVTQVQVVTPQDLQAVPELESPTVTNDQRVTPLGLQATVTLGAPTVTQVQTVTPEDLQAVPELEAVAVSVPQVVAPQDLQAVPELGTPAVTQLQTVTPQALQIAVPLDAVAVSQAQLVTPEGLQAVPELEAMAVSQNEAQTVVPLGLQSTPELEALAVAQVQTVTPQDLQAVPELEAVQVTNENVSQGDDGMSYTSSPVTQAKASNRDDKIVVIPVGGDVTVALEVDAGGTPTWQNVQTISSGTVATLDWGLYHVRMRLTPVSAMEYQVITW